MKKHGRNVADSQLLWTKQWEHDDANDAGKKNPASFEFERVSSMMARIEGAMQVLLEDRSEVLTNLLKTMS